MTPKNPEQRSVPGEFRQTFTREFVLEYLASGKRSRSLKAKPGADPYDRVLLAQRLANGLVAAEEGSCWEWTRGTRVWGYGRVRVGDFLMEAHRLSYELAKGPIPPGLFVLHACDNPPCINPDHLSSGTPADNAHDRDRKGRQIAHHGSANGAAKLTEDDVREIRRLIAEGESPNRLGPRFGVHSSSVYRVARGEKWRSVA